MIQVKNLGFTIVNMSWERIFLNIDVQSEYAGNVSFKLVDFGRQTINAEEVEEYGAEPEKEVDIRRSVDLLYDEKDNNVYKFCLNMSAIDGREFLDNGRWRLCAFPEGDNEIISVVHVNNELAYKIDDFSRIFRYGKGKYAYNLSFSVSTEDGENLELFFNNYFMIVNKKWKKRRYIQEAFTAKGKVKRFYMYCVIWLIRGFYHFFSSVTPKNGTKILFMSETKDYLWGNLKYIDDRIKERGLDDKFHISYSLRKSVGNNKSALSWIRTVFLVAKQDYIFIDDYAPIFGFFKLSPKTKLIQVWHAGEGFKSVGYSRFGKAGSPFPSESCHKAYTYALTGSRSLVKVYEEVFGIEKSAFLPTGMARLDDFLDANKIEDFKMDFFKKYPEFNGKKIILFAPTFRGTGQHNAYYDYDMLDLKRIYEFCGNEWIFLVKMHPFVREPIEIPEEYADRIRDFAECPNINDLYYVTDILITDYSSNYYEFALMEKPVLFYTYDREFYELTRGVHRDVKSHAPGKVCDNFDELMNALKAGDYEEYKIEQFVKDNFSEYDGHAADKAIDAILLNR